MAATAWRISWQSIRGSFLVDAALAPAPVRLAQHALQDVAGGVARDRFKLA
jgi:hypothetical protein